VETQLQQEFLRAQGCGRFQGCLFSAAMPPQEFALLLEPGIGRTQLPQQRVRAVRFRSY
jgi:sensor c-di-GMP phosphodiesterase-like protein